MNVRALGDYIRTQRRNARLSLKKISTVAGVSVPYLSQIERGLRKPSAEILQAIAKGLRISAETLYVQAGILEERPVQDVTTAVLADPSITERQKQALIQIYEAFRDGARRVPAVAEPSSPSRARGARSATRGAGGSGKGPRAPRSNRTPGARTGART